jgi:hypothetical protein
MHGIPRIWLVTIGVVTTCVVVALVHSPRSDLEPPPGASLPVETAGHFPDSEVEDWVSYADHVAVYTVIDEEQVPPDPGEDYVGRLVTLRIDEVLWSAPNAPTLPAQIEREALGWTNDNGTLVPLESDEAPRVELGEQYLAPLAQVEFTDGPRWWALTPGSHVPLAGGEVDVASWSTETNEALQGMTVNEVEDVVEAETPDPTAADYAELAPQDRVVATERDEAGLGEQHIDYLTPSQTCPIMEYPFGPQCNGDLHVGEYSGAISRSLVQFDLSGIPATATVIEAKLQLTKDAEFGSEPKEISVMPVRSAWNDDADWDDNGVSGTWESSGGDFDSAEDVVLTESDETATEWEVTALVTDWLNGARDNHGVGLLVEGAQYNSNQQVTYGASSPRLKIAWTP